MLKIKKSDLINTINLLLNGGHIIHIDKGHLFSTSDWTNVFIIDKNYQDFNNIELELDILSYIINAIKTEEITLNIKNNKLEIKTENINSGIQILEPQFKELNKKLLSEIETLNWKRLPDNFFELLKICSITISNTQDYAILQNIHLKNDIIESFDQYKALRCFLSASLEKEILISIESVKTLNNIEGLIYYSFSDGFINFTNKEKTVFIFCRIAIGEYPDLNTLFNEFEGNKLRFPEEIKTAINRASLLANKENDSSIRVPIILDFKDNIFNIKAKGSKGFYNESISLETDKNYVENTIIIDQKIFSEMFELFKNSLCFISDRMIKFKNKQQNYMGAFLITQSTNEKE